MDMVTAVFWHLTTKYIWPPKCNVQCILIAALPVALRLMTKDSSHFDPMLMSMYQVTAVHLGERCTYPHQEWHKACDTEHCAT